MKALNYLVLVFTFLGGVFVSGWVISIASLFTVVGWRFGIGFVLFMAVVFFVWAKIGSLGNDAIIWSVGRASGVDTQAMAAAEPALARKLPYTRIVALAGVAVGIAVALIWSPATIIGLWSL